MAPSCGRLGYLLDGYERKLGGDHALDDEIRSQIESCAVFLAVVSPLYLNSPYCTQEREWFLDKVGKKLKVGNRLRGLRVVKTPQDDGSHETVFAEGFGFEFFRKLEDEEFEEFTPTSAEFNDRFGKTCRRLKGLLQALRRDRISIYVAQCPSSLQQDRQKIVTELTDQGYRVLPEMQIDSLNVGQVAKEGIETAELSVHLLAAEHDDLPVRQARIAIDIEKPLLVWTSHPELYREQSEYGAFLAELMKHCGSRERSQYLDRTRLKGVKTEVLELLQSRKPAPARTTNGARRVYILCDGSEKEDFRGAWKIMKWIKEQDKFEVDLPETAPLDPSDLRADHEQKLSACDGLLLYWGQADQAWYDTIRHDLARPFRSKAIAFGSAKRSAENVASKDVIHLYKDFRYEALDPFLQPLRL